MQEKKTEPGENFLDRDTFKKSSTSAPIKRFDAFWSFTFVMIGEPLLCLRGDSENFPDESGMRGL
jgi:hypothetical protein